MARICPCGAPIPPQTGRGRPRTKCAACRPSNRGKGSVSTLPAPERASETLEVRVRAELEAYGRADSTEGAAALYAARMLDAGGHTGSAAAALLRQMTSDVRAAKAGASLGADLVDELRAKRDRRRGA